MKDRTLEYEADGEPWRGLVPGQRFLVTSLSNRSYEVRFIAVGPPEVGLYVRLENGKLGRLALERVRWDTLDPWSIGEPIVPGDRVYFVQRENGARGTGRVVETSDQQLAVEAPGLEHVPLAAADRSKVWLGFTATRLYVGEEFCVESRSGNLYRGAVHKVGPHTIQARLDGERSVRSLDLDRLDKTTLTVLVRVMPHQLDASPVG